MSIIPDCRPKYKKDVAMPYKNPEKEIAAKKNEINPYWYGLLKGSDESFLQGYDWNTTQALYNLFDNLEIFADVLEDVGIDFDEIDESIVNGSSAECNNITMPFLDDKREWKSYNEYSEEELTSMSQSTKIMLVMKSILAEYIESSRDSLVTSMIEDMTEEEYEQAIKIAEEE